MGSWGARQGTDAEHSLILTKLTPRPDFIIKGDTWAGAMFSPDEQHRYLLWRRRPTYLLQRERLGSCAFLMLNPSTANEHVLDPTVRRCLDYATRWDFNELVVINLFAVRATQVADMKRHADPVGVMNDEIIAEVVRASDLVVCAWGNHGTHRDRAAFVLAHLIDREVCCLSVTKSGQPGHPLYLKGDSVPVVYRGVRNV